MSVQAALSSIQLENTSIKRVTRSGPQPLDSDWTSIGAFLHYHHTAVENMHKTFLEALRHREQEILRFIAILAPALGGFIWLLNEVNLESEKGTFIFTVGSPEDCIIS